jgi:hypothetical protein
MFHVSVINSDNEFDRFSVSRLFRRAADVIDDLGTVVVHDVVVDQPTMNGLAPSLTVYYSRPAATLSDCACRPHAEGEYEHADGDEYLRVTFATLGRHSVTSLNSVYEPDVDSVAKLLRTSADSLNRILSLAVDDTVLILDDVVLEMSWDPEVSGLRPMITVHYRLVERAETLIEKRGRRPPTQSSLADGDDGLQCIKLKDRRHEPGYLSRPRLLRKTAKAIEALGEVEVLAVVLHEELTDWKWIIEHVSFTTVYYTDPQRRRRATTCCAASGGVEAAVSVGADDEHVKYSGHHIHPEMAVDLDNRSFRLRNPVDEPGYCSVPTLLRRTADAVDALPDVEIDDLVLHVEVTPAGRVPTVTVYYSRPTIDDWQSRAEWARSLDECRTIYFAQKKVRKKKRKK